MKRSGAIAVERNFRNRLQVSGVRVLMFPAPHPTRRSPSIPPNPRRSERTSSASSAFFVHPPVHLDRLVRSYRPAIP